MAFDGVTVAAIIKECKDLLTGSRIYKIAQPEPDELQLTLKTKTGQYYLLLSASASLPLIYLTGKTKQSPLTAPNFCMLLRKHIQNGRIVDITQPGLERIMQIDIEHLNEMGDLCRKKLMIEIMGKHSNIIFCNKEDMIIDSIKHISGMVSSVREVLPGKTYFIPKTEEKTDPVEFMESSLPDADKEKAFHGLVFQKPMPLYKALYTSFTGFSPILAQELCFRSNLDADRSALSFLQEEAQTTDLSALNYLQEKTRAAARSGLYEEFSTLMKQVISGQFSPVIVYDKNAPVEFAAVPMKLYSDACSRSFSSISALLETYYAEKNALTRIRQRSADLRKIVQTILERTVKKYDLQLHQIKDTEKREKYKLYGELLHTYGYGAEPGAKSLDALNYYTGETITIPLDPTLTASENAKKYFDRYGKLKRTYETLSKLTLEVKEEIDHLESIAASLDIAEQESDLVEIKEELIAAGYIRRKGGTKKEKVTSRPFHYISSDGFHMYVGKNNFQNDELTFKFAVGNDWWFHAKGQPGSHVVVRTGGEELPDSTFEEAARLAAHYSKGRGQEKVEIDYTEKKNVKKPGGAKPGFVVYYTNYSMMIDSDITGIEQVTS
ncbi:MAG: fibronectin/fibrinogen-binding protein [Lachnospiraceae bacterium]|nr:fibronectin/fibrinogen-binding protein [Lachnospiraceae bacterium]